MIGYVYEEEKSGDSISNSTKIRLTKLKHGHGNEKDFKSIRLAADETQGYASVCGFVLVRFGGQRIKM